MQEEIELVNGKFIVKGRKQEEIKVSKPKEVVPKQHSQEVLALRDRIIIGNKKLNDAWEIIKRIDHKSQRWKDEFEKWHLANEKLSTLCSQLKGAGYVDCLYIKYYEGLTEEEEGIVMKEIAEGRVTEVRGGVKTKKCLEQGSIGCRVCPSQLPYWEQEFSEL